MQSPLLIATGAPNEMAGPPLSLFPVAMLVTRRTLTPLEDEEELEPDPLDPVSEPLLYVAMFRYTTAV